MMYWRLPKGVVCGVDDGSYNIMPHWFRHMYDKVLFIWGRLTDHCLRSQSFAQTGNKNQIQKPEQELEPRERVHALQPHL